MDTSVQTGSTLQESLPDRVSYALWPYWLILVAGAAIGAVLVWLPVAEVLQEPMHALLGSWNDPQPLSFGSVLADSAIRQFVWLGFAALLGFFSLAAPLLWLLVLLRGLGIGFATAFCLASGVDGLLPAARMLLPGLLSVIVFLYACREARQQSGFLCRCFWGDCGDQRMGLYGFLFRYAVYFALALVCAAAEAACVLSFAQMM